METEFKLTIDTILVIIGMVFASYFWIYSNTKVNLTQSDFRKNKIAILKSHHFEEIYKLYLKQLLHWLDDIYCNSSSEQNYSRHITIALVYSFSIFLFFWILGAKGTLGSIEILKHTMSIDKKVTISFFVVFYILITYLFYKKSDSIIEYTSQQLHTQIPTNYIVRISIAILISLLVLIPIDIEAGTGITLVGAGALVGIGIAKIKSYFLGIFTLYLIYFTYFSYSTPAILSIETLLLIPLVYILISIIPLIILHKIGLGMSLAVYGLFTIFLTDIKHDEYVLALFLLLFPLANGALDYISLEISKYMSKLILKDKRPLILLLHLLLDAIIAIILLLGLALILYFALDILKYFRETHIPIKAMLNETYRDPFSIKNGWITFMLLSTLVPTLTHLILAIGALLTVVFPAKKTLRSLQDYQQGQEAKLESAAHYFTRILFLQVFLSFAIITLIIILLYIFTNL